MFKPVGRAWRLLTVGDKRKFIALTVARSLVNILDVAGLLALGALGVVIASTVSGQSGRSFLGIPIADFGETTIVILLVAVGLFFVGKSALGAFFLRAQIRFLTRVEARTASMLLRYVHSGPISRIQQLTDGKVLWLVNVGTTMAISGLLVTSATLLTESVLLLLVFSLFVAVDPVVAVVVFSYFAIIVGIFQWGVKKRLEAIGADIRESGIEATNRAHDLNSAFREITVLSRKEHFFSLFDSARFRLAQGLNREVFIQQLPRFIVEVALMVGVLALVGWQATRGSLSETIPTIAILLAGGVRMMAALLPLQGSVSRLRIAGPQAEPVLDFAEEALLQSEASLTETSSAMDGPTQLSEDGEKGLSITAEGLSFSYRSAARAAVVDVSLQVPSGSFVAVVGPSGAGKSTLADLLLGVQEPSAGTILLDGRTPEQIRAETPGIISYVPQDPGMVSGTIAQNVALGISYDAIDRDRVRHVLAMAELTAYVEGLPQGIDTDLGSRRDALSGGQRQRLGLARALYTSPRLIVLDEATSALDASTEASISQMIRRIGAETTLVVIAHRLSTIQHADAVLVLDEGRLIAQGTFPQVRKKVPMIEEYVRLMSFDDLVGPDISATGSVLEAEG